MAFTFNNDCLIIMNTILPSIEPIYQRNNALFHLKLYIATWLALEYGTHF